MRKKLIIFAVIIVVIIHVISAVFHERQSFSVNAASTYLIEHAYEKSHNRCAWHVMCAMNAGGQPVHAIMNGISNAFYRLYFMK